MTKQTKAELQAELEEARKRQGATISNCTIKAGLSETTAPLVLALAHAAEENAKAIRATASLASAEAGATAISITGDVTHNHHHDLMEDDTEE